MSCSCAAKSGTKGPNLGTQEWEHRVSLWRTEERLPRDVHVKFLYTCVSVRMYVCVPHAFLAFLVPMEAISLHVAARD